MAKKTAKERTEASLRHVLKEIDKLEDDMLGKAR